MREAFEIRRLSPPWTSALGSFFEGICENGDDAFFHPHPLDRAEAARACSRNGDDLFYAAVFGGAVIAYGLLRGWDQGYEIPSIGIAVSPAARGHGIGRTLMWFLQSAAALRGAPAVRLKVHPDNESAVRLYRSLGYSFDDELSDGQLVGHLRLRTVG